jgi:outer membrane autotransporter protein
MNNIYKSKWNESTQTWVACSELARGKCKSNGLKIVAAVALALASTSVVAADTIHRVGARVWGKDKPYYHNERDMNTTVEINFDTKHTSEADIIQNDSATLDINIDGHHMLSGNIVSRNTPLSSRKPGDLTIENKHGEINGGITNEGAGDITINNSFQINGNITSTEDSTGNITIKNIPNGANVPKDAAHSKRGITNNITNNGAGTFTIDNKTLLEGTIKNTGIGKITLDNSGKSTGDIINDSDSKESQINVTNNTGTTFDSTISNKKAGKITLTNHGTITKSITNSGTQNASIEIINGADALLGSDIKNTGAGTISLNNSGKSTGNIVNESDSASSKIEVTNDVDTTLASTIFNAKAGTIELINNGTITKNVVNLGTGTITLNNSGTTTGNIINSGQLDSLINVTNNNGATLNGNINNTGAGTITLENSGVINNSIINSSDSVDSKIIVTNNANTTLGSAISNTRAGKIELTNKGTTTGDITNSGQLDSLINVTNNNGATLNGNINNTGAGTITLENSGVINNSIINSSDSVDSKIIVTNNANTTLGSAISNTRAGKIELTNKGTTTGDITNSGQLGSLISVTNNNGATLNGDITNIGAGTITLENSGAINKGIINNSNSADSKIIVTNNADTTLASTISNTKAGKIELTNKGITTGDITNSGQLGSLISVTNNNGATLNSDITNIGAGTITLENSGVINKGIINNSDSVNSKIIVTNNADTTLASMISNTKAGTIELTNKGTTTGDITNIGDDSSIDINNEASLKSKIANMRAGKITLINSGTVDNTEIINSGDGEITVHNNKTLLNTNIINEVHGTGNISFTNSNQFEGKLINNTDLGRIDAMNTGTFIGTTGTTNSSGAEGKINLDNQGTWINTGDSTLSQLTNTGIIEFSKIPLADINDENKYHTITVEGDYTGSGTIYVNTLWNDDSISKNGAGYTDRVNIKGDVTGGVTTVTTREGIYGDITQKEIPITHPETVIHVDGQITGQGFEGTSATKNAGEAQLKKIDQSVYGTGTDYAWTLKAQIPTNPAKPTPPKEVPIYAEPVSGYVQMPTVNMELGFTTIGTLYERRAENQTYNITGTNNTALANNQQQTWGRVLMKHLDKNGKRRLDTVGNQSVLQIGHDFILDENNKTGTRRHIGAYVSYGHNENDFRDQYRAENGYVVDDHYTGKGRTDAVSVGSYGTFYGNNGGYIDLVGQVSYLRNKYNARSNESVHQNGWGAALSAETGKSFTVYGNNWFVEPQVQLAYQYLSLDNFNDGIRQIDQHNPSALRGRVGMRFGYNGTTTDNLPPSSFYGIANIWHDFVNPKSVDIGRDTLKEEYAKTWGEVGVGIQLPITRQSDFYSDVRYEKNFGSVKRKGFKGTLGYKYTWL